MVSPDEATLYWQKALLESDFKEPPLDANVSETHFIEVAAPLKANVSEANITAHANKSADLLELGTVMVSEANATAHTNKSADLSEVGTVEAHRPVVGATMDLSENGYHAVAMLKNSTEME